MAIRYHRARYKALCWTPWLGQPRSPENLGWWPAKLRIAFGVGRLRRPGSRGAVGWMGLRPGEEP